MERKIVYPFKRFILNIIIGLGLMLLAFNFMPIYNLISSNINRADADSPTYSFTVYFYGYNEKGEISRLGLADKTTISDIKTKYGHDYVLTYGGKGHAVNVDRSSALQTTFKGDNVIYPFNEYYDSKASNNIKQIKDASCLYVHLENEDDYVVGYFQSSYKLDWRMYMPQFKSTDLINNYLLNNMNREIGEDSYYTPYNDKGSIHVLLSKKSYKLNLSINKKILKVGNYEWESPVAGSPDVDNIINYSATENHYYGNLLPLGGYNFPSSRISGRIVSSLNVDGFSASLKGKNSYENYKELLYDYNQSALKFFIANDRTLQIIGQEFYNGSYKKYINISTEFYVNKSTTPKNPVSLLDLDLVYRPTTNFIQQNGSNVVFNITSGKQLSFLAYEVKEESMNEALGNKYIVNLQNDIDYVQCDEYNAIQIGIDDDNAAFKGTFNGNGHTINKVELSPYDEEEWVLSGYLSEGVQVATVVKYFGLFGRTEGARIRNFNIGTFGLSKLYNKKVSLYTYKGVDSSVWADYSPTETVSKDRAVKEYERTETRKNYNEPYIYATTYHRTNVYGDTPYARSSVGSICGSSLNSTITDITIKTFDIKVQFYGVFNFGGLVGYTENTSISRCHITEGLNAIIDKYQMSTNDGTVSNEDGLSFIKTDKSLIKNWNGVYGTLGTYVTILYDDDNILLISTQDPNCRFGGLVGYMEDYNRLSNCSVKICTLQQLSEFDPTKGRNHNSLGGIVGEKTGDSIAYITNCSAVSGSVLLNDVYFAGIDCHFVGGVIGKADNVIIQNCYSAVDLSVTNVKYTSSQNTEGFGYGNRDSDNIYVGGIAGSLQDGSVIKNCLYDQGNIVVENKWHRTYYHHGKNQFVENWCHVGGIAGRISSSNITISDSAGVIGTFRAGKSTLSGKNEIKTSAINLGYIAGVLTGDNLTLTNCYGYIRNFSSYSKLESKLHLGEFGDAYKFSIGSLTKYTVTHSNSFILDYATNTLDKTLSSKIVTGANYDECILLNATDTNGNTKKVNTDNYKKILEATKSGANIYGYNSRVQNGYFDTTSIGVPFLISHYNGCKNIKIDCDDYKDKTLTYSSGNGFVYQKNDGSNNQFYIYGTAVESSAFTNVPLSTSNNLKAVSPYYFQLTTLFLELGNRSLQVSSYNTKKDSTGENFSKTGNTGNVDKDFIFDYLTYRNTPSNTSTLVLYPIFNSAVVLKSPVFLSVSNLPVNMECWCTRSYTNGEPNFYYYTYTFICKDATYKFTADNIKQYITSGSRDLAVTEFDLTEVLTYTTNPKVTYLSYDNDYYYVNNNRYYKNQYLTKCSTDTDKDNLNFDEYYLNVFRMKKVYFCNYYDALKDEVFTYRSYYSIPVFFGEDYNEITANFSELKNYGNFRHKLQNLEDKTGKIRYSFNNQFIIGEDRNPDDELITTSGKSLFDQMEYDNDKSFSAVYILKGVIFRYYATDYTGANQTPIYTEQFGADVRYDYIPKTWEQVVESAGATNLNKNYAFVGWKNYENENGTGEQYFVGNNVVTLWWFNYYENGVAYFNLYPIFITKGTSNEIATYSTINNKIRLTQETVGKESYYKICNEQDFITMSYITNYYDVYQTYKYKLFANLDMSDYSNYLPIGYTSFKAFSGTFDGQGYTINGLNFDVSATNLLGDMNGNGDKITKKTYCRNFGMFGELGASATITNFNLININYKINGSADKDYYMGGVAGKSIGGAQFSKISVQGSLTGFTKGAGILGREENSSTNATSFDQCVTKVSTTKSNQSNRGEYYKFCSIIGIAGASKRASITNCFDIQESSGINPAYFACSSQQNDGNCVIENSYSCFILKNYYINNNNKNVFNVLNNRSKVSSTSTWYNNVSKDIWNIDAEINNGLPYLKNVGIVTANFVINSNYKDGGYVLTDSDKQRLGDNPKISKQYFVLDKHNYTNNLANLYLNKENLVLFNELEGYTFSGYNVNVDGTDYLVNRDSSTYLNRIFTNNNETYNLVFKGKIIEIYYGANVGGTVKTVKLGNAEFGTEAYILETSQDELFKSGYIYGYRVLGYRFTDINKNNKQMLNNSLIVDATNNVYYPFNESFIVSTTNDGSNKIYLIADNEGLEKVSYRLDFCDEDGNQFKTNDTNLSVGPKYFGDSITLPTVSSNPEIVKTGYNFTGWYYINNDGEEVKFEYQTMPELRNEMFNNNDGNYFIENNIEVLKIFAKYSPRKFTITYQNGILNENNNDLQLLQTFNKTQSVDFDGEVQLYSQINNVLYKNGYVLTGYRFTDATIKQLNRIASNEEIENWLNLLNSELRNGEFTSNINYAIPSSIVLDCLFSRVMYEFKITDLNDMDLQIYYEVVDEVDSSNNLSKTKLNVNQNNEYVINTLYNNIINIYTYISNGQRIKSIKTNAGDYVYNFNQITSLETYFNKLDDLQKVSINLLQNEEYIYDIEDLTSFDEISRNENGDYLISSSVDLVNYVYKKEYLNINNVYLTNNIDLTGVKFNMPVFYGTFNGNGYSINGFTSIDYLDNSYSFIGINYGTIKNLVFNNVSVNINNFNDEYFGLINKNYGQIQNVYVKNGLFEINSVSTSNEVYIGVLVGLNANIFENNKVNINVTINNLTNNSVYAGLLIGYNNHDIKNLEVNGVITATNVKQIASIVGYLNNGEIKNIIVGSDVNTILYAYIFNGTIKNIVNYATNKIDSNLPDEFVYAYDYGTNELRYILKNVDNKIYFVKSVLDENSVSDNIISRIYTNKVSTELGNSFNNEITIFSELNNTLGFKQTEYSNRKLTFILKVYLQDKEVSTFYNITNTLNEDFADLDTRTDLFSGLENENHINNLVFNYSANEISTEFEVKFRRPLPNFTEQELDEIFKGIEILNNGEVLEYTYTNNLDESGETIISCTINLVKQFRFNDKITLNINLPNVAKLEKNFGVQVGETKNYSVTPVENSKDTRTFSLKLEAKPTTISSTIYTIINVERSVLELTLNLNKENLLLEEQPNIKFNAEFYNNKLNEATLNEDGTLTIKVNFKLLNGKYIYTMPSLTNVLDYIYNGKHYTFGGFVDENNVKYYNEKLENIISEITESKTLYAVWEEVEYKIIIDNSIDNLGNGIMHPILNNYKSSLDGVYREFNYSSTIELPTVRKNNSYDYCYKFIGYKIKDTNIFVTDKDSENVYDILDDYKILNINYTKYANSDNIITLVPVFNEVEFNLTFHSNDPQDEYRTVLKYNGEEKESFVIKLTISQIKSTHNFTLPLGEREYHKFVGFKKVDSQDFIAYDSENDLFTYLANEDILLHDADYYAVYEIHKVDVIIKYVDCDNSKALDYQIENFNDVINYEVLDDGIKFILNYGSKNINLPTVKILNDGYRFNSYVLEDKTPYTLNYTFVKDVTILVKNDYLVEYYTKGGTIENYYINLTTTNYGYNFYSNAQKVTLPTKEQVNRSGFELVGFKSNGENITELNVTEPIKVEFIYSGIVHKLTLTTYNSVVPGYIPLNSNVNVIEDYQKIDDSTAIISVLNGTKVDDIKANLPAPICYDGYTFISYNFSESDTITQDGTISSVVRENIYKINIYENNTLVKTITNKLNETINNDYTPSQFENLNYIGLSLIKDYFVKFDIPETMPMLETEYSQYVSIIPYNNEYTLNVYAYYSSDVVVKIVAGEDYKLPETYNLTDYYGGGLFNSEVSFKLTASDILNGNIKLPTPITRNDLRFKTFKGYSYNGELVVDSEGTLLDTFKFGQEIVLTCEFEENIYDFNIYANYSNIENIYDFVVSSNGFTKKVAFGEIIGNLPVINLDNLIFKGYYFSNNLDSVLRSDDIQISDEFGTLLDDYKNLTSIYFNDAILKNIVAKYEYDYVTVKIDTNNKVLGTVGDIISINGNNVESTLTETGYIVKIIKGDSIIISSVYNSKIARYLGFTINKSCEIEDANSQTTIIYNVIEDLEIVANFEYIEFNITYIVDDEVVELTPSSFNYSTETFDLPIYTLKTGYEFVGWYLEKNFVNKITTIETGKYINDLVLYALLEEKVIGVNIYSNNIDGYANVTRLKTKYNTIMDNLPKFTLSGYNFVGLFTEPNGNGVKVDNLSKCVYVDDINLYTYFEIIRENNLNGKGTSVEPFEINNFKDFKAFASLINYGSLNNSNVYFKLTNSINLEENIVIENFNANFDADGFVIYSNNKISSFSKLDSEGKIVNNLGLFNTNNGKISNLILVNNLVLNLTNVDELNLGNVAGVNNGEINNIIVYYNATINFNGIINLGNISSNNENETKISVYNSKITINSVETIVNDVIDEHLHSKNISTLNIENDSYAVSTSEEFAYLLTLQSIDKQVILKNDIDLKGKLFDKIDYELKIISNGYEIKNLIVLNNDNAFNNLSLNSVAFENVVNINLFNSSNFILNANGIDNSFITFSAINSEYVIENNNAEILNSYFIGKGTLINTNNSVITNSYVYGLNLINNNLVTNENFIILTSENIDEFYSKVDKNIWFIDSNNIMGYGEIPSLYTIGNYVTKLIFNEDLIYISTLDGEYSTTFVTKYSENFMFAIELSGSKYALNDIIVNGVSDLQNFENKVYTLYKQNTKITNVEFIVELKDIVVTYKANIDGAGKFNLNNNYQIEFSITIKSGESIIVEAVDSDDYYFTMWADGVETSLRTDTFYEDTVVIANYLEKTTYNLITQDITNLTIKNMTAFKVEDFGYSIKLGKEDINNYLPTSEDITKLEYRFDHFTFSRVSDTVENIYLNFVEDYVNVDLVYNNTLTDARLISNTEFSPVEPTLRILQNVEEDKFEVLRNKTITLNIIPNYSYVLSILINNQELSYDYDSLINNTDELNIDIEITENSTIEILMQEVLVKTTFEFDNQKCSIKLINNLMDIDGVVTSQKGKEILFTLTIDGLYEIDNFEVNGVVTEIPLNEDGQYSFIPLENSTVKINLKEKKLTVVINYSNGGKVLTNIQNTIENTNEDYANSFAVNVSFGENLTLNLINDDNYVVKSIQKITLNSRENLRNKHIVETIKENLTFNIDFEKVETWLDVNEENTPIHFMLNDFGGAGTKNSPYIIGSVNDFLTLAYNVNILKQSYTNTYFKTKTLDLTLDFSRYYFSSIGTEETNFDGIILGNNLTLKGIKIVGNSNVGLFKTLGENAVIRSINISSGEIDGNYLVGSICGTNNGSIIGCSNSANIKHENYAEDENNIVGGICAINNNLISRSYNAGTLNSVSYLTAGICAINNSIIENIYNVGYIYNENLIANNLTLAGICAKNSGTISLGYNDCRINCYNEKATISGTTINNGGTTTNVYYNSTKLTAQIGESKTYEELSNKDSAIYQSFDFKKVWYFDNRYVGLPKLNTVYEYSATITFVVTFSDNIKVNERLLLIELTNRNDLSYCVVAKNNETIVSLYNLNEGEYYMNLISLLGNEITLDKDLKVILNEEVGENITININLTSVGTRGYYGNIII